MARERGLVALDHGVNADEAVPSRGDPHLYAAAVCEVTRDRPVFSLVQVPCRDRPVEHRPVDRSTSRADHPELLLATPTLEDAGRESGSCDPCRRRRRESRRQHFIRCSAVHKAPSNNMTTESHAAAVSLTRVDVQTTPWGDTMEPAIVLLSGGLDSATVLAIAQSQGFDCLALSFRYGQSHEAEVDAATSIAKRAGVRRHVVVDIDLRVFGGSALTSDLAIPKHDEHAVARCRHPDHIRTGEEHDLPFVRACVRGGVEGVAHLRRRQCCGLLRLSRLPSRIHRSIRTSCQPGNESGSTGRIGDHDQRSAHRHVES